MAGWQSARADTPLPGQPWASQPIPRAQTPGSRQSLAAVSCPSAATCIAVGSYVSPTTGYAMPLVETSSGGVWTATELPLAPLAGSPAESAELTGVSCVTADECVAVGEEFFTPTGPLPTYQLGLAEELTGSTWSATLLPPPPPGTHKVGDVVSIGGVSCVTLADCVAVGSYAVTQGEQEGLAYTLSDQGWSSPVGDVDPGPEASVALDGVSCGAEGVVTACSAVGWMTVAAPGPSLVVEPLAESYDGASWRPTLTTNPAVGTRAELSGVSCVSLFDCVAVGTYTTGSGAEAALTEATSGGPWVPTTGLTATSPAAGLSAVSCVTVGECSAVGWQAGVVHGRDEEQALVETLSGAGWAATVVPEPGHLTDAAMTGLSCPTLDECLAVGTARTPRGGLAPFSATPAVDTPRALEIDAPPTVVSGHVLPLRVTAVDAAGAEVGGYYGTVAIASTDPAAELPAEASLVAGGTTVTGVLVTAGPQVVTVSAPDDPSVAPASVHIEVTPAGYAPSPPVGLSVQGTVGAVALQWYPPLDNGGSRVTSYSVWRGRSPATETPVAAVGTSSYVDAGLPQGVRWYYSVTATNAFGRSVPSNQADSYATGDTTGGQDMAATPDGKGWWTVTPSGDVAAFGAARLEGSLAGTRLAGPVVGMAATPDGGGYWMVGADGGIFSFGDARFYGSLGSVHLRQPIVGMAAMPDGRGYTLVAADGGIFCFGDARFYGSLGSVHLEQPVVGMAAAPNGTGYWLVAADGGIFSFGGAPFEGSLGAVRLDQPVVGMAATPDGHGYWVVGDDGGVFCFGDAGFFGSLGGELVPRPIIGLVAGVNGTGYSIVNAKGVAVHFGS